ncbi:ABA4-like family protein [Roseisolibacter sp. H3M3-2]|uniref:ABA4-like family protein n=1 Tax=Roseisolibacter sp. H3M3-2 TaxID=3031323 RepID=UPI0023DB551B|nr:ABA4-like family protein [Roseisolibacter sp. H3M3-2]MDF1501932.1 ABA4-like family protein [Roseisolibacter sp. H3M3-2]
MPPVDPRAATLFGIVNAVALVGWLLLAATLFVPRLRAAGWRATGIWLPLAFGVAYVASLAIAARTGAGGGFGSIAEVRTLFAHDFALTGGWLHYLAFDLFVGTWIARHGVAEGVPALPILPCLALTFLFGPAGLLAFFVLRAVAGRRAPAPA